MFVSGQSVYAGLVFSFLSYFVAIPSAIKVFNWTATLHKGSISYATPMLYAFGFIGLFTVGGLTGLFVACLGVDVHVHDTYFVIAHFHYIMVGGTLMAYLGGLHYWWPKMSGRMYPEGWAKLSALIDLPRLQPDLLPAIHSGLPGHAATLLDVSGRVPGAARHVHRRRFRAGGRISDAADLLHVVAALRTHRRAESVGRHRSGMADRLAAARAQLRRDARSSPRRLTITPRWRRPKLDSHTETLELREQFETPAQQKEASTLGMWIFLVTEIMFFGGLFLAYAIYRREFADVFALASNT